MIIERKQGGFWSDNQTSSVVAGEDTENWKNPNLPPSVSGENSPLEEHPKSDSRISGNEGKRDIEKIRRALRKKRWEGLRVARKLFFREGKKDNMEYPQNFHRTAKCMSTRMSYAPVELRKTGGKAYYTGVMKCGSVWSCPVCSTKIQLARAIEIKKAIDWAYEQDKKCAMVTFTFPHYDFHTCSELLEKQARALRLFRCSGSWQRHKTTIGYVGMIRTLEITKGENGFHPHTHELWIIDKNLQVIASEACKVSTVARLGCPCLTCYVKARWFECCLKVGLIPKDKIEAALLRGADIKDRVSTSDYLQKTWGGEQEMAYSGRKKGGKHPFQLLEDYAAGNEKAGADFLEYSIATRDRRARQCFWSKGLKDKVGVKEKEDKEIVEEEEENQENLLHTFTYHEWEIVQKNSAQLELIEIGEKIGRTGIEDWFLQFS
jgi:hypothetical protein